MSVKDSTAVAIFQALHLAARYCRDLEALQLVDARHSTGKCNSQPQKPHLPGFCDKS